MRGQWRGQHTTEVKHLDTSGKGYILGELVYELGLASREFHDPEVLRWQSLLSAVAERTGMTSYLMRRDGLDATCLMKVEGSGVIRVVPVEVGQCRPLGLGAGSIALLSTLDEDAISEATRRLRHHWAKRESARNEAQLREAIRQTRETGFARSTGTVAGGYFGMGAVIQIESGLAAWAVSIAGPTPLATESAIAEWQRIIVEEIAAATS